MSLAIPSLHTVLTALGLAAVAAMFAATWAYERGYRAARTRIAARLPIAPLPGEEVDGEALERALDGLLARHNRPDQ